MIWLTNLVMMSILAKLELFMLFLLLHCQTQRVFMTSFSNQVHITLIKHFDEKHEYQERLNLSTT